MSELCLIEYLRQTEIFKKIIQQQEDRQWSSLSMYILIFIILDSA